jgi:MtaA/CmuA family methyltransferase
MTIMTGRERVLQALQREKTDRIPWVPFVGCHAAALLDMPADEFLKSEETIVRGVQAAIDRYEPDGIPVAFDLQMEAEALGCELAWSEENPPAVTGHPLVSGTDLRDLHIPGADAGRIGAVLGAARTLRKDNPDVALYGLLTGPFTLALHLMGTDIFMKMFDAVDEVRRLLSFCRDVAIAMADYYLDAGCDVIALVDPMTSQIGPDQFRQFVSPVVKPVFEHIRAARGISSFFVCGHAQQNIEAMCECLPDNISVDENIPLQFVREVCTKQDVSFGGNMQLTSVLLLGSPEDCQRNAVACMEIGGDEAFILAPGCDLPYATPPENLVAVREVVVDEYRREAVKSMADAQDVGDHLDMSQYGQTDKVVVDIITIDSEACAPCQYMVDAVQKVAPEFEGLVEWREHKIKYRESLVFMTSLMVRNVPTICIDGQITFVSRIPPRDELIAAIQRRINEKFRTQIRRRKATLYLLGKDCDTMDEIRSVVDRAVTELGADVTVQCIDDEDAVASYGIAPTQTPAVVLGRYQVKSTREVPEVAVVKEWIKDVL